MASNINAYRGIGIALIVLALIGILISPLVLGITLPESFALALLGAIIYLVGGKKRA